MAELDGWEDYMLTGERGGQLDRILRRHGMDVPKKTGRHFMIVQHLVFYLDYCCPLLFLFQTMLHRREKC